MAKIEEMKTEECQACGNVTFKGRDGYSCDACDAEISVPLTATVFRHGVDGSQDKHYCNWRCLFVGLRHVSTDYFVTLPYLSYDCEVAQGQSAADFWALVPDQTAVKA